MILKNLKSTSEIFKQKKLEPRSLTNILIWDVAGPPPDSKDMVILWKDFTIDSSIISIPQLINSDTVNLRERLTSWVYDVGAKIVNGKTVSDYFELRPGFSYWWMTAFSEMQHFGKSPQLYYVVRLMVFENWINNLTEKPSKISYISDKNFLTGSILELWCRKKGIEFQFTPYDQKVKKSNVSADNKSMLFHVASIILYLTKYSLDRIFCSKWNKIEENTDITFLNYIVTPNDNDYKTGHFTSVYWTKLIDLFNEKKINTNWLHFWVPPGGAKKYSTRDIFKLSKIYNNTESNSGQSHNILNTKLGFKNFISIIKDYIRLCRLYSKIKDQDHIFHMNDSLFDFSVLFKPAFDKSIRGKDALQNLIYINLFEEYLRIIPKQKAGFYLQENLCWEKAFIYFWKKFGHQVLIGVPHVTIRPWDLRYFIDNRSYHSGKCPNQKPDFVAINSNDSKRNYLSIKYPENELLETEALRYLHLNTIDLTKKESKDLTVRLLILGDYLPENIDKQMQWLKIAANALGKKFSYIVKPHPVNPITENKYPVIPYKVVTDSFAKIFPEIDIVFASNVTSAAVDAYSAGIPVITMVDGSTFEMSPLKGYPNAYFVSNPEELIKRLLDLQYAERFSPEPYFYTDPNLTKWEEALRRISVLS